MTLAQLIASVYVASMLTGARRSEANDLPVRSVGFQNGPAHPVDDLLVTCGEGVATVTLAVACRATPNFVNSDQETVKLVKSLLAEVEAFDTDTHRVAVATLGWNDQWEDLAKLSAIARVHAAHASFEASVDTDGRWTKEVRGRYAQFKLMVGTALGSVPADEVSRRSWRLLSRLHVLGFAVQSPDESDRTAVASTLDAVADAAADGVSLRDRLESLIAGYDSKGGVVDLNLVRRDLHPLLNAAATRSQRAWDVLAEHRDLAVGGVRTTIGEGTSGGPVQVSFAERRAELVEALRDVGMNQATLLVSGESGIGKSALTLSAVSALELEDPDGFEAAVLNFRSLPQSTLELRTALGMSVQDVLAEMSAPSRVLVIDAADVALERSAELLSGLVLAAKAAGVGVVAVSSDVAAKFVTEQLTEVSTPVTPFAMESLGDEDVRVVADAFPLLAPVLRDLPAKSLLRRPVVLDLLARAGVAPSLSLGEWDVLELIWSNVVRADGRPGAGSAEAREQTLLAAAAAAMQLPAHLRPAAGIDAPAVEALRRNHLLAPANLYRTDPEFAHDEVRRYATAILLVRAAKQTDLLHVSPVRRSALSAATLACKGALNAAGVTAPSTFLKLLIEYRAFADTHGTRWADVPVEAALETSGAYECLKAALDDPSTGLVLADVVRIVQQRHKSGAFLNPVVAASAVRILLDDAEPWNLSKDSFVLLADWLTALLINEAPAGHPLRIKLRERVLAYWNTFPAVVPDPPTAPTSTPAATLGIRTSRRRLRGQLDYHQTNEEYVETMALLGADIDDELEGCLRVIAADAPSFLAPAADSPFSSRGLVQRDPELLADLMEAYYVDNDRGWLHDEGVRPHQGRWTGAGGPFFMYYFGGFWQLFNRAHPSTQARVLNVIMNSGANARVRTIRGLHAHDPFAVPVDELDDSDDPVDGDKNEETHSEDTDPVSSDEAECRGAWLNLDGTSRFYVGDSHVWSWYRGTSVGPYSAMSGLQAMERVAETWLNAGASVRRVIDLLLTGCENLAVPGMLFGLLVRNLESVDDELDGFLAEPIVWEFEFARRTSEYSGLRARTEGLHNLDRREWTPREVAAILLARGGAEAAARLKKVGEKLIENGDRLGIERGLTLNWAASLDAERYNITQVAAGYYLEVEPPAEVIAAQEAHAAYQEVMSKSIGLQNRYWGSVKFDATRVPPTASELATDLATARELFETESDLIPTRVDDAVAHVVRAVVEHVASTGDLTAFGDQAEFATEFIMRIAETFTNVEKQSDDDFDFDLGADRAVAVALPAYLTDHLDLPLTDAGVSLEEVDALGAAMAGKGSLETRLYLARGCDVVWTSSCAGAPCRHRIAMQWLLETARNAEIGPWDQEAQRRGRTCIEGDVAARLAALPGDSVDVETLAAVIRGLGAAAVGNQRCAGEASELLAKFLEIQAKAMVVYAEKGYTGDDRGNHTLIAARALLDGIANNSDLAPTLAHLDILSADARLMSNFLHGLAGAGAENERRAQAARDLWPTLFRHALTYATEDNNPYRERAWGKWVSDALLPQPATWSESIHNECTAEPIDWVQADKLLDLIDDWVAVSRGESRCVDGLINLLRRVPLEVQVRRGIAWVSDLCVQDEKVTVHQSWFLNDWLKEVRHIAEELVLLERWQVLVDSLVVAGNEGLASYSR